MDENMKKTAILTAALLSLLCACRKHTDDPPAPVADPVPIRLSIASETKVSESAYEEGDIVGLYVVNDGQTLAASGNHATNVPLSYKGNQWNSPETLYWKDQDTPASFYCYYPYRESIASIDAVPVSVHADQSALDDYKASEVLWGKRENVTPTAERVEIRTSHRMSNLFVSIVPGNGYTTESLAAEDIAVTLNGLRTSGTLNLKTGEITATGSPSDIVPNKAGDSFRALVLPQTHGNGALLVLKVGANSFSFHETLTLKPNTQHHVTLTVNKETQGINIGIDNWETDGEDYGGTVN